MDLKTHILQEVDGLFCQFGIKSVTMDDIAKHLGISKKTIYQHFGDKNELVVDLMSNKMENQVCIMDKSAEEAANAVNEVFIAVANMQSLLSKMNPMLFYDLHKYHPEAWFLLKSYREKDFFRVVWQNLVRGIDEGYYRKELNLRIITKMRIQQMDTVFDQTTYPIGEFSMLEVVKDITEHYLYGICTLDGHRLINKYK